MIKKIKKIAFWVITITYIVISMSFVKKRKSEVLCHDIKVSILDSLSNGFITEKDIEDFILQPDMNVVGNPIYSINTKDIEENLNKYSSVKNAEVFVDLGGNICVEIDQRNPIIRIVNKHGQSYYIDQEGVIMPLSNKYASHVLIANGNIVEKFDFSKNQNALNQNKTKQNIISDLYTLAKFIYKNEFWKSQIEQIYINKEHEFELVPRVGAHIIYMGDIYNYQEKFRNLKEFYLQGLNTVGWNKYVSINLKFENQVICTKR